MDFKVVAGFELKVGTLGSYLPGLENSNKTEQSAQTHHISTDPTFRARPESQIML